MNTEEELAYIRGRQSAWVTLLRQACIELGPESKEANADRWRIERAETVRILRQVCACFGDNDWPDELHLGDVIEKHLWRALETDYGSRP